jgi:hypothetical protein
LIIDEWKKLASCHKMDQRLTIDPTISLGHSARRSDYRVDGEKLEKPLDLEGNAFERAFGGEEKKPEPEKPGSPILWMIEEARPGSFLAISEGGILNRTDKTLQKWEQLHDLGDLVRFYQFMTETGDYEPDLRAVHVRDGQLLLATAADGYVRVDQDGPKAEKIPDQLDAGGIDLIEATAAGVTFWKGGDEIPWRLRDGRWIHEPIDPPIERPPAEPVIKEFPPGASHCFATANGELWAVRTGIDPDDPGPFFADKERQLLRGCLFRLVAGKWVKAADLPRLMEPKPYVREYLDNGEMMFGSQPEVKKTRRADGAGYPYTIPGETDEIVGPLCVVGEGGTHRVIFDQDGRQLFGRDLDPARPSPGFAPIAIEENQVPLKVEDALAWKAGEVLIATRKGVKLVDVATGKVHPAPLPSPDRPVKQMVRDGLGRLWLAGDGLWMIDSKNVLHDLAEVPMVGRSAVSAIASDPAKKDGVIVSLGVRGVAFIGVEAGL